MHRVPEVVRGIGAGGRGGRRRGFGGLDVLF